MPFDPDLGEVLDEEDDDFLGEDDEDAFLSLLAPTREALLLPPTVFINAALTGATLVDLLALVVKVDDEPGTMLVFIDWKWRKGDIDK